MNAISTANEVFQWLGHLINLATFLGVFWGLALKRRENRSVTIWAVCGEARKRIAVVPARFLTRAEVLGLVGQKAGAARVDLSKFQFRYDFDKTVWVPLAPDDFAKIPE